MNKKNKGDFMNLFQGIKMEYSKVQWPKKEEIVNSTLWVIVMSLVLSVYLGVFDLIASRLLKVLVSLFGG
jgi:preprotein translocase subunit SecE